jgi:hypothetical protein
MADEADLANDRAEADTERAIAAARKGAEIPAGEPGDYDFCGEWSGRLVRGACAPCRDKRRLP